MNTDFNRLLGWLIIILVSLVFWGFIAWAFGTTLMLQVMAGAMIAVALLATLSMWKNS